MTTMVNELLILQMTNLTILFQNKTAKTQGGKSIDIFSVCEYNNSTRQATACVCRSAEVRECAGKHCLMELSGGVVQRNLKPA